MEFLCKHCKLFDKHLKYRNCKGNVVGVTRPEDSACYKIQFNLLDDK